MITPSAEKDRVILSFSDRGKDLQLSPDQAERLAEKMEEQASICEAWMKSGGAPVLLQGGTRGAMVKSWDGKVNVRFDSITKQESIPYQAARALANEIRAKATEAALIMSIQWKPQLLGV